MFDKTLKRVLVLWCLNEAAVCDLQSVRFSHMLTENYKFWHHFLNANKKVHCVCIRRFQWQEHIRQLDSVTLTFFALFSPVDIWHNWTLTNNDNQLNSWCLIVGDLQMQSFFCRRFLFPFFVCVSNFGLDFNQSSHFHFQTMNGTGARR